MPHVLIIGYGNPLREDDGIGWAAAEKIAEFGLQDSDFNATHYPEEANKPLRITVEALHQLLPELAEPISRADLVIFVDAAVGGEPGEIRRADLTPEMERLGAFSHHVGPSELLECARVLYGRFPPATLFTVTAAQLGYGEGLSTAVAAALPELLQQISKRIYETT